MPKLSRRLKASLRSVFEYNPPEFRETHGSYPTLEPPLSFYDKHLDQRLAFKRIVLLPSMATDLSRAAVHALSVYKKADDVKLPPADDDFPTPGEMLDERSADVVDARSVGLMYERGTAISASIVASMLLLHPNSPEWQETIDFMESGNPRRNYYDALNEDYAPIIMDPYDETDPNEPLMIAKETWESMNETTQRQLRQAHSQFPITAVWQIFFVRREARRALKRMDATTSMGIVHYPQFRTVAPSCAPKHVEKLPSPDAKQTAWGVTVASFTSAITPLATNLECFANSTTNVSLRRSIRLSSQGTKVQAKLAKLEKATTDISRKLDSSSSTTRPNRQWSSVVIPTNTEAAMDDVEMAMSILQHVNAWARAVERDATFIVLHCGTYERIAFRHRSSQTLFISELINVEQCSDPAYGAIHVGLYISIMVDIFDRIQQVEDLESTKTSKKRKQNNGLDVDRNYKRPKTRSAIAREEANRTADRANFKLVCTEVSCRPLALLRIEHHHFNSPSPASFLRCNPPTKVSQSIFEPNQYFLLTITSQIGDGATGDVHAALMELQGADGTTLSLPNVVVKFAFRANQRQRMRHEFKVYEHLQSCSVSGIPYVFGLFKDMESDTLALVMTNGGKSLDHRRTHPNSTKFAVSKGERDQLIEALDSIHATGVRHRDIRAENLTASEDGSVNIIDFDRASLDSSEQARKHEMEHLISLLDGHGSNEPLSSLGSFRESEVASEGTPKPGWENSVDNSDLEDIDSDDSSESQRTQI
ncbi:hypothetical protein DXG01_008094 [Tephrocybe rancida]|nr:hypothetical protein DXG01_008094 [Tephrocybe rancida]